MKAAWIAALALWAMPGCGGSVDGGGVSGFRSCGPGCDAVRAACGSAPADCESQCDQALASLPRQCAEAVDALVLCAATDPAVSVICGSNPQVDPSPAGRCKDERARAGTVCSGVVGVDGGVGPSPGPPCTNVTASCDVPGANGTCTDWSLGGGSAVVAKQYCKGTWSEAPCDRTGSAGGCRIAGGGVCTDVWFYAPSTPGSVQQACPGAYQSP